MALKDEYIQAFKEGALDAVAMYGALFITTISSFIVVALLFAVELWLLVGLIAGIDKASRDDLKKCRGYFTFHSFINAYLYWYKEITKLMNKLVK